MEKLLIIDGNNLLFQMFYGIPTKIYNKERETIHATIGFISAIQRIVKENAITKIIVVFDKDPAFDKIDSYNDYKANRTNDFRKSQVSIYEEKQEKTRKTEILFFKLIFSKNSVDKAFLLWYYIRALKKEKLFGGFGYVYIYGKTCRGSAQMVHH